MNLYVVTIAGNRFYFRGDLSESECKNVEKLCDQIASERIDEDVEKLARMFQTSLEKILGNTVEFVKIKYVFRI